MKKITGYCLFLIFISINFVYGQATDVFNAYSIMKTSVRIDSSQIKFAPETNSLRTAPNLVKFTGKTATKVGLLVGPGDYSKYYKNSTRMSNRYTWVFYPDSLKAQCIRKGIVKSKITDNRRLSERLCKFLGLSHTVQRDTVVFFEVQTAHLFRPAYTPDVNSNVAVSNALINGLPNAMRVWFVSQQIGNFFPWTRMGYTYDWGDPHNYIGTSEFILKPGNPIKNVSFDVLSHYLP